MNKKICPKCKSENVQAIASPLSGNGGYKCNDCGFFNNVFPEIESDEIKLEEFENA